MLGFVNKSCKRCVRQRRNRVLRTSSLVEGDVEGARLKKTALSQTCPLTHCSLSVPLSSKDSMENCNSLPSESLGEFSEREENPVCENP